MATAGKFMVIQQGVPVTAAEEIEYLGLGSAGERTTPRRLVHPNPNLAPIVYWANPTLTINLDNLVLKNPRTETRKTLGTTQVIRHEEDVDDVIVTEMWETGVPSFFVRQLYEYWLNVPDWIPSAPEYVQWFPYDRTDGVAYNVEILFVTAGGGVGEQRIRDILATGGKWDGGDIENALDSLNVLRTGVVDEEVRMGLKIVSEV